MGTTYKIAKELARKRFEAGEPVVIAPGNVTKPDTLTSVVLEKLMGNFDKLVSAFEDFNCSEEHELTASFFVPQF